MNSLHQLKAFVVVQDRQGCVAVAGGIFLNRRTQFIELFGRNTEAELAPEIVVNCRLRGRSVGPGSEGLPRRPCAFPSYPSGRVSLPNPMPWLLLSA